MALQKIAPQNIQRIITACCERKKKKGETRVCLIVIDLIRGSTGQ